MSPTTLQSSAVTKLDTSPRKPPQITSDSRPPKQNTRPSQPPEFARTAFEARVFTSALSVERGWPDTVHIKAQLRNASGTQATTSLWLTPDEADALSAAIVRYRETNTPQVRKVTPKNA